MTRFYLGLVIAVVGLIFEIVAFLLALLRLIEMHGNTPSLSLALGAAVASIGVGIWLWIVIAIYRQFKIAINHRAKQGDS